MKVAAVAFAVSGISCLIWSLSLLFEFGLIPASFWGVFGGALLVQSFQLLHSRPHARVYGLLISAVLSLGGLVIAAVFVAFSQGLSVSKWPREALLMVSFFLIVGALFAVAFLSLLRSNHAP